MEYSARRTDTTATPDPARAEQLKAELSGRLRSVCAHLADDEFAALVDDIADVKLRYELRPRPSPPTMNERPDRAD
jgi:hypothetical protein